MTNPYRAMCAELVDAVDLLCGSGDSPGQPGSRLILTVHVEALEELAARARALLDQPVAEGPTDEELRDMADFDCDFDRYDTTDSDGREGVSWECSDKNLVEYARAVLAKYGTPTAQPPAAGEVAELVKWLRGEADADDRCDHTHWLSGAQLRRIAELLQRQHLQPVAVSERLPGPEDCTAEGRCWLRYTNVCNVTQWSLILRSAILDGPYTHWLPSNALPLPVDL